MAGSAAMPRKLPLWLTQFPPGEPAHGVLLRIAELNGLAPVEAIELIGGEPSWIYSARTTDAILREVGAECSDLVQKSTPRFEGNRYVHVNGERLSSKLHWIRGVRRRCPLCLSKSPHHRVWWDSSAITACTIHAVELEDRCLTVGCDCQIRWTSGSIGRCENNHDLTGSCRSVPASELSAEAYIAGRLGLPRYDPVPFLDGAYLDDAIELMDKVGRAAIGGNLPSMPTLSSLGVTRRAAILSGFAILKCGEIGFEEFIGSITRNMDQSISRSLTPLYGWLHRWLRRGPRSSIHNKLLGLMARYATGHVPTAAPDDPFVSLGYAAKQLKIHPTRLRRILRALGLIRAERRHGLLLGIRREHVERVRSILQDASSLKEAAIRIGESQNALIRVVHGGLLPIAFRAGTEGHGAHILKKADVDKLIARLNQGVPQVAVPPADLMSLARVARATSMQHAEIIRLVLATKLRPAARLVGAPPISGLYFHYREVRSAYLAETRTALTSESAAKEVGVSSEGFRDLLQGEYIKGESRVESKRRFVAISRSELDRFKLKYAAASEFSEILATNATRACTRLVQLGLQPAITRDKCRKYFFYRKDVEALLSRLSTIPTSEEIRASFWLGLHKKCQCAKSRLCIPARNGGPVRIELASGIPNVRLAILFSFTTSKIRVGFCFSKGTQQGLRVVLKSQIHRISRDVGIQFVPRTKDQNLIILADCPRGKLFDRTTWPEIYDWILEICPKLLKAMHSRLKGSSIGTKQPIG
ncbi:hypothetical protein FOM02_19035 [Bradyrhizobium sp. SEMIA]|nr:hypothetical protein FOM02_19035 [Bradyrhizobium sp. SEMIA]